MKIDLGEQQNQKNTSLSAATVLRVRCGLRSGVNGDCALGVNYWRKQYNYAKQELQRLGCS